MQLQEFYSLVSTAMKRGTELDAVIPLFAPLACNWLERNYTMKYMESVRLIQVDPGDRTIELQSNQQIKEIVFIRMIGATGDYKYLNRKSPKEFTSVLSGPSDFYWVAGTSVIVLENVPDSKESGEALFNCYSAWPKEPEETHPLLKIAPDVMMYQTLLMLAAHARDVRIAEAYIGLRNEGLNTLTRAEDEFRYGSVDQSMAYVPYSPG